MSNSATQITAKQRALNGEPFVYKSHRKTYTKSDYLYDSLYRLEFFGDRYVFQKTWMQADFFYKDRKFDFFTSLTYTKDEKVLRIDIFGVNNSHAEYLEYKEMVFLSDLQNEFSE